MRKRWKVALGAVAVLLAALYFTGRLDYALYNVGLNFHTCARNGFGATFCGSDLTAYERRFQGIQRQEQQLQQQVQQQVSQEQQTLTQQECQADPQLSICPQP